MRKRAVINTAATGLVLAFVLLTHSLPGLAQTRLAALPGNAQVTLSWTPVEGATSYNVYMATQTGVGPSNTGLPDFMAHTGANSPFTHTGLANGTNYFFVVTAMTATGEKQVTREVSSVPSAAVGAAISGAYAFFSQVRTVLNAHNPVTSSSDLSYTHLVGFFDSAFLNEGRDGLAEAKRMAHENRDSPPIENLVIDHVNFYDETNQVIAVGGALTIGGMTEFFGGYDDGFFVLKRQTDNATWLSWGDQRIAKGHFQVEMRTDRDAFFNAGPRQHVNFDVEAPLGTITSASVTGPGIVSPLQLQQGSIRVETIIGDLAQGPEIVERDAFYGGFDPGTIVQHGTTYTLGLTKAGGGSVSYPLVFRGIAVTDPVAGAINVTSPTGHTLADAQLGSPLSVQWTLPTAYPIVEVRLDGWANTQGFQAQGFSCYVDNHNQMLLPNATSGTITLPQLCNGEPLTNAGFVVSTSGANGQRSAYMHGFSSFTGGSTTTTTTTPGSTTTTTGSTTTTTLGGTVGAGEVTSPIVEGRVTLWSNGESRTWGHPYTLPGGTQVFPRRQEGGVSASGSLNLPAVQHYSLDANGLRLHENETTNGTTTYTPARVLLPPAMSIGQTIETVYTQTFVSAANGANTTKTNKDIMTIVGVEPVATPMGTFQALKLTTKTLTALADGSYPSVSTVPTSEAWYGMGGAGLVKRVVRNPDGTVAQSQSIFRRDAIAGGGLASGVALSGPTILATDVASPFTEGRVTLWTNGETRTNGHPYTATGGFQVFPRRNEGGVSVSGALNSPSVQHYSFDGNGLLLHKNEATSGSTTFPPARVLLPPTMTIGQTIESVYSQTFVSAATGASTTSTAKDIMSVAGIEPVETPLGTFPALKLTTQTLVAAADGSYPSASTVPTSEAWYGSGGAGLVRRVVRNPDGSVAQSQTIYARDAITVGGVSTGAALTGTTFSIDQVTNPLTEGRVQLWTNGETRTTGQPYSLAAGAQVFPRLVQGGVGVSGQLNFPNVQHLSLDGSGLLLYKNESTSGTTSFSPARVILPPAMAIGQTLESVHAQTFVSAATGASTQSTIKDVITVGGVESLETPLGTFQALKLTTQTLVAGTDGSYPSASTVPTQEAWYGSSGMVKRVTRNPDGTVASAQSLFAATTRTSGASTTTTTTGGATTTTTTASTTTTTLGGGGQVTLDFSAGWNLVGNSADASLDVATAFGDTTKVTTVWKWVAASAKWAFYAPSLVGQALTDYAANKGYDVLTTVSGGEGFWVNARGSFTAALAAGSAITSASYQDPLSGTGRLVPGWNLIAIGDNKSASEFNKALSATPPSPGDIPLNLTTLWAWDNAQSNWYFYAPSLDKNGTLSGYIASKSYLDFGSRTLDPATGFWVNKP
ncbi:MAG: hypothetical protein HYU75_22695 [Betaproteobacteria bacterium]|nr:hypothetical protein [Betaproteobacteria bacterium]